MGKSFFKSLQRYIVTGLFVLIPVGLTVTMVWLLVRAVDGVCGALFQRMFGFRVPGLGLLLTVIILALVGMLMSNLLVQQIFGILETGLRRIPGVGGIYKTVKALADVFAPSKNASFRYVVLVEYPHAGSLSMGFVTRQFSITDGEGREQKQAAVYVPTNHLYLGNTIVVPQSKVFATSLTVQEGVQVVISSGASLPKNISVKGLSD